MTAEPEAVVAASINARKPRAAYWWILAAILVAGVLAAIGADNSKVVVRVKEGVSVFALFYILAQAMERLNEVILHAAALVSPASASHQKKEAQMTKAIAARSLAAADQTILLHRSGVPMDAETVSDANAARSAAAEQKDDAEDQASRNSTEISLVTSSVSFSIALVLVAYFHSGILSTVGVEGHDHWIDTVITALALMGGTKALHDLISRVQDTKDGATISGTGGVATQ